MKSFKSGSFFLWFLPLLVLLLPSAVLPEASKGEIEEAKPQPMVIKADTLEIDNERKIVTFTGSVDAKRDNTTINCQKMLVYYKDQPSEGASEKMEVAVDRIVAKGKVKISLPNGVLAMSEQATYYESDEKVILTGKPMIKQGKDFVEGSKVTLFLREGRSIVEGSEDKRVKLVVSPKSKKR